MLLPDHLLKRFAHYNDSDFTLQRVMVPSPLSDDEKSTIRARHYMYDDILRPYMDEWEEAMRQYEAGCYDDNVEDLLDHVAKTEAAMIPHLENMLIARKLVLYIDTL